MEKVFKVIDEVSKTSVDIYELIVKVDKGIA